MKKNHGFQKGVPAWNRGRPASDEAKRRMSISAKKRVRFKASLATRAKMSAWQKGKPKTALVRANMSMGQKGKRLPLAQRLKIGQSCRVALSDPVVRAKISVGISGAKNPNWRGGISIAPYTPDWTRKLKIAIRMRDHYKCKECGAPQGAVAHDVHHIDYNKKNSVPGNLITLCKRCHTKTTNGNRERWIAHYQGRVL